MDLLIFDLDGTLHQSQEYLKAFSQILTQFVGEKRGEKGLRMLRNIRTFTGHWSERTVFALDIPWGEWIECLCSKAPIELIQPNPGRVNVNAVRSLLSCRKVVYTYGPRDLAFIVLERIGFELSDFDLIVGSEKTDRIPIKAVRSSHVFKYIAGLFPECDVRFSIGDSWKADGAPAKRAGFVTVGIGGDGSEFDEADSWFETVEEFVDDYHKTKVDFLRTKMINF